MDSECVLRISQDRNKLLRWILSKHPPGIMNNGVIIQCDEIEESTLRDINVEQLLLECELSEGIELNKLISTVSESVEEVVPQEKEVEIENEITESRDFTYPTLIRRYVPADPRPVVKEYQLLRDSLLSSLSVDRSQFVLLCAYEELLISSDFSCEDLLDIEMALELPTVIKKSVLKIFLASNIEKSGNNIVWRAECLLNSFRTGLEAFNGSETALKEWQLRSIFFILEGLSECGRQESLAIADTLTEMCRNGFDDITQDDFSPVYNSIKSLCSGDDDKVIGCSKGAGIELYCSLLLLSIAVGDDDDPLNSDDLFNTLKPFRSSWGFSEADHDLLKNCLYIELLTCQGGKDLETAQAISSFFNSLSASGVSPEVWNYIAVPLVGRLYSLFLVPHAGLKPSTVEEIISICETVQQISNELFPNDDESTKNEIIKILNNIDQSYQCTDENNIIKTLLVNAATLSATNSFKRIVENSFSEAENSNDEEICVLDDGLEVSCQKIISPQKTQFNILFGIDRCLCRHAGFTNAVKQKYSHLSNLILSTYLRLWINSIEENDIELSLSTPDVMSIQLLLEKMIPEKDDLIITQLRRLGLRIAPSASAWLQDIQDSMISFINSSLRSITWTIPDGDELIAPQILDMFACLNENVSNITPLFFCGSSSFGKGIAQSVSGSIITMATYIANDFPVLYSDSTQIFMSKSEPFSSYQHSKTTTIVAALNSLSLIEDELPKTIRLLESNWTSFCTRIDEPLLEIGNSKAIEIVKGKVEDVMRHLASKITYFDYSDLWCSKIYTIDIKHYKKYKHDKKYLTKNGPHSMLKPGNDESIERVLNSLNNSLECFLPYLRNPRLRLQVVEYSLEIMALVINWLLFGESSSDKIPRFHHEDQTPSFLSDIDQIEEFYREGVSDGMLRKYLGRLRLVIQFSMGRPTSELLGDSYNSLPQVDDCKPHSKQIVNNIIKHRKDKQAKKFSIKLLKEK